MVDDERLQGNWFWRDLEEGIIHIRDQLQLELKSEFKLHPEETTNEFFQEFFLFIPESLQINRETYNKEQFYGDETNIVRFKTPNMSFDDLLKDKINSPLNRLDALVEKGSEANVIHELKMYGNIFRSTLRNEIRSMIEILERPSIHNLSPEFEKTILTMADLIQQNLDKFQQIKFKYNNPSILETFKWTDEFFAILIDSYLTAFLDFFRRGDFTPSEEIDKKLSSLILKESKKEKEEELLMRYSLLNKYMIEALQIKNSRIEVKKKHTPLIGMAAAGIAMMFYMVLFTWKISNFAITSFPFVALVVIFYILKDRLKEGLKDVYWKNFTRWFPDYSTELKTAQNKKLGSLQESVLFIDGEVPQDILAERAKIQPLEDLPILVPENCLYYKKGFSFRPGVLEKGSRRQEITSLFRLNLHKFIEKANDSIQTRLRLNPESLKIEEKRLPKGYYLFLILKNKHPDHVETKKFKITLNKTGIERVQYLRN